MDILDQIKKKMNAAMEHLKSELKGIRTGRASPALVENVPVEVYGTKMKVKELANINAPEARLLVVSPFDNANAGPIAKGIEAANLNVLVILEGNAIRIKIPEMDASMRQEMVKQTKRKSEESKISIRNIRREGNEAAKKQKSEGTITEDQVKKLEKNIQEQTDKFCKMADDLALEKEKEIQKL